MHILLIHQAFTPPNKPGGTRHYELFKKWVDCGQECTIIASDVDYLTGERITKYPKLHTKEHLHGINILRSYTYASLHISFVWRIVSFFSFMFTSILNSLRVKKVDIVMGTSPPIFQAFSAWVMSALMKRPFLLEIRDLWPEFAIDIGVLKNPILIYLSHWLERFLYKKADHILVNSPAYKEYLINKGIPGNKITLIPNGVDTDAFEPNASGSYFREKWNLENKFVIIYAGALGLANDISSILKVANNLKNNLNIHFVLVGDGKEKKNLQKIVRQLNLTNVTFAGVQPKNDMPNILAAADACIAILQNIPMFRTTYPNKVFDYMAAGRSTILVIDGVIREVIESAGGGIFVPPGDIEALEKAIIKLEKNRDKNRAMGNSARDYVVRNFDRKKHSEDFGKLLLWIGNANNIKIN